MKISEMLLGIAGGALFGLIVKDLGLLRAVLSYGGDVTPFVVVSGLIGMFGWASRLKPAMASAVGAAGMLWVIVVFTPLASLMVSQLVRQDSLRPASAVLVLNAGVQDNGAPTGVSLERLLRGLEMVGAGYAPTLIITELPPPHQKWEASVRSIAANLNIKTEIIAVGTVRNTHDEAVAAAKFLRERGQSDLILVTSPTHTLRAAAVLAKLGVEVTARPALEGSFNIEYLKRFDDRPVAFMTALHEHLGMFVYRLRGWAD